MNSSLGFEPEKITTSRDALELEQSHTKDKEPENENSLYEIIKFLVIALIIVVPIRMFVAQPFIVSGASMENTFNHNEYLIVDQLTYQFNSPERGEVVIFRYPQDPSKFFIKRVIALPGDTISIDGTDVTIINEEFPDGFTIDEPYVKSMERNTYLEETLLDREFFVLGDNRDESSDSRIWGVLQEEYIVGRAWLRLFPPAAISFRPGHHDHTKALQDN